MSRQLNRRNMPEACRDSHLWPALDLAALDPGIRAKVESMQCAICAYLQNQPIKCISVDCGVSKTQLLRAFNRCLSLHEDGNIHGWRALLPGSHVRDYVRLAPPRNDQVGNAGAFTQFLRTYPEIKTGLDGIILRSCRGDSLRESRYSHREHLGHFRRLCAKEGIPRTVYPLNAKDGGRRAVSNYALELLRSDFAARAARLGGKDAIVRSRVGLGIGKRFTSDVPFDLVSMDAHKLNFVGCIGIPSPQGIQVIPIDRLHFIGVAEESSTAYLGYHIAIGREPAASDIEKAVKNALSLWRPRRLSLPGLSYPKGAGMPSAAVPGLQGVCWNCLLLDNATIHCSTLVTERLRRRLGCALNFGPVGQWYRRPLIECLGSALERSGFSRLPNSTGFGPADPLRPDSVAKAVKHKMMLDELFDLIDIQVCTYNGTERKSLGNLSPLERLSEAMLMAPDRWMPRNLPRIPTTVPELGTLEITAMVRGSAKEGRRPYVQFSGVRYSGPLLSGGYELIGKALHLHVKTEDLRSIKAFLANGAELGELVALGGWDRTPHDLALRKAVIRAIGSDELVVGPGEDPVQQFVHAKAQQAIVQYQNRSSTRPTISSEATALTRAVRATRGEIPAIDASDDLVPALPCESSIDSDLPSFIPTLRHRGTQR